MTVDQTRPQSEDLAQLAGQKLGNYRLERVLGRGRMGVVYLARDEALLRPTAVKVLSWSAADAKGQDPIQWFLGEARLVARINHPRVVQIYGAARQGDRCYIAMEYVAGVSAEAATSGGPMRPELATDVLLQAASALHAAHRCGVVHRDVKPANLLIGTDGITKLGDFGLAFGTDVMLGNANVRVGTPYYTAPEIWRGEAATPATDIYALGATYFQLLTGRPPFTGADHAAVEQGHLRSPPPDPRALVPALPDACAALVTRALAKSPGDRHATAQVLVWEARRVLHELVGGAGGGTSGPRSGKERPAERREEALTGPLAGVLGFTRRPFSVADPASAPYRGEPIASAIRDTLAALEAGEGPVVAVTGDAGTGRTQVCRAVAAALTGSRLVLHLDLERAAAGQELVERLCRAAGTVENALEQGRLDGLVERFAEELRRERPPAVVVLDGVSTSSVGSRGVDALIAAALWSRSFRVVLAGGQGLRESLVRAGFFPRGEPLTEVGLPPLTAEQVGEYVRCWVAATRPATAPALLFTPDAVRLLALRSRGTLGQVGRLAENMLVLAAWEGRRVLTSWHAWSASERERWEDAAAERLPRRPESWPTEEVLDLIDACRSSAGVGPWPRGRGR